MDTNLLLYILFWGFIIVLAILFMLFIIIKVFNILYKNFFKDYYDSDNE